MEHTKAKFCPAMWFSGFFGLGAFVHLVRSILGFGLVVAGHEISVSLSIALAIVLGVLSIGLLVISMKRPCESGHGCGKKEKGGCCGL